MARLLLVDANLLDGENPARPATTVIVEDGRIVTVGSAKACPPRPGDAVVDLAGMTLMPGMVGGHFHAAYRNGGSPESTTSGWPESQVGYTALGNAQTALQWGFTSVVSASTFFKIDPALAQSIDAGLINGPRYTPCTRGLATAEQDLDSPYGIFCSTPAAFARAARDEINGGAKIVKLFASDIGHGMVDRRAMTEHEVRTVVEIAHELGARVRAHLGGRDHILRCVRAGVDVVDHADFMDEECIEAFVEHGTFVLPSLYTASVCARGLAYNMFAQNYDPAEYYHMVKILPKAAAAGVKIVTGDDFGLLDFPHGTYAREFECYVEDVGISPLEVLRWATRNGGELTGVSDLGTIAPGKRADMVIVDGDPSKAIGILGEAGRIVAVFKDGDLVSGSLPQNLAHRYQAA